MGEGQSGRFTSSTACITGFPPSVDMLQRYLAALTSADDSQAEWAIAGLASLPPERHPEAIASLNELLKDPDPDRRWWAVRAWSVLPSETNLASLISALQDPQPEVRQCAAIAFRLRPDPAALSILVDILLDFRSSLATVGFGRPRSP